MSVYPPFYVAVVAVFVATTAMLRMCLRHGLGREAAVLAACLVALVVLIIDIIRSGVPR